jgi:aldehyde dehydrogenase (NAD+)
VTQRPRTPTSARSSTPAGGTKASGIGRFGGRWAIDEFTTEHWVSVQHDPREYPLG